MGGKFKRVPADIPISDLSPLNISCGSTKCDDGLHCFKTSEKAAIKYGSHGVCKECGTSLIDWNRVHENNIMDAKFIFESMKNELIRHVFWHTPIEQNAVDKALKSTKGDMRTHAKKVLKSKIGHYNKVWDGRQTPLTGNEIVNYAQHATATCCRKCLEYWHNIKKEDELTEDELEFCTDLAMLYIEERVPNIPNKKTEEVKT